ncbi:MAG: hypothetical protein FIA82_08675 [Melioribacter sp.]|nr:hypothetical protein [Melioribacter sp.]
MVMKKIVFFFLLTSTIFAQNVSNLADAVKSFSLLKVREFLNNGADPNTMVEGEPAVCYIAKYEGVNTIAVFDELVKYGANPNSISKQGNSLLSITMSIFNAKGATELIKRGADLNYKNKGTIPPPLIMAVAGKRNWPKSDIFPNLIKFMIENKADVNIQDSYKTTPLMMVIGANDFEWVKFFLDNKSDPNLKDLAGETPLVIAAERGQLETVKALLDHGADPNILPGNKETALMRAAQNGHKDVVLMLLEKGAKTNFQNTYHETALRLAQLKGHKEIIEILKKSGAKK